MPKPSYAKALSVVLSFVLSLLGALALYPRQVEIGQVIYIIPPPFSAALPAGIMYTLLLIVLSEAATQLRSARGRVKQPAAAGFIRLEKLYAAFSALLFLACVWLELNLQSLHTLYWKLERVFICVWLVGLALEVAGSLCVRSPWAFMRYLYMGMLGCVSAFALYWNLPEAAIYPAVTFFGENLQPLYIAGIVAAIATNNRIPNGSGLNQAA